MGDSESLLINHPVSPGLHRLYMVVVSPEPTEYDVAQLSCQSQIRRKYLKGS
jgi:hypothetical protein